MANKQNKKKNNQLTVYKQKKPVNKAKNNEKAVTKYVQEKPVKKSFFGKVILPFIFAIAILAFGIVYIALLGRALPAYGADEVIAGIVSIMGTAGSLVTGFKNLIKAIKE